MSRTGPRRRAFSTASYVVVRGSRGLVGGREGGDEAGDLAVAEAGAATEGLAAEVCRRSRQTRSRRNRSRRANSTVVKVASAVVSDDASGCCAVGPLCNVPEDAHAATVNAGGAANDKPGMTVSSPSPPAPATRRRVRSVFLWRPAPSPWPPALRRRTVAGGLGRREIWPSRAAIFGRSGSTRRARDRSRGPAPGLPASWDTARPVGIKLELLRNRSGRHDLKLFATACGVEKNRHRGDLVGAVRLRPRPPELLLVSIVLAL